jgi:hypothetical protein
MRSGLKHLLAYRLTKLDKPCYIISRSFVFQPIKFLVWLPMGYVGLEWPDASTAYSQGTVNLYYNGLQVEYHDKAYIYGNRYYVLEDEQALSLYSSHQFKEFLNYCRDKSR